MATTIHWHVEQQAMEELVQALIRQEVEQVQEELATKYRDEFARQLTLILSNARMKIERHMKVDTMGDDIHVSIMVGDKHG